jgi:hypothetical protein
MCYYHGVKWIVRTQFPQGVMGVIRFCLAIGIIFAILLGGCSSTQTENNNHFVNSQNQNDSVDESSLEPTSTRRPPSTPIPTLEPTATVIPVPTLELDDQYEAIGYWFATNDSCEFPCWWGIVPGQTKWQAAEDFLRPLVVDIEHQEDLWYLDDGAVEHKIALEVPENLDVDGISTITMVEDWWGTVSSISVNTNFAELGLGIKEFLEEFGMPSEVFVYSSGSDSSFLGGGSIFTIGLFYQEAGILIAYFGISEEAVGADGIIQICSSELIDEFAWLELWDPALDVDFVKIATPGLSAGGDLDFYALEEISDLAISDFYEGMTQANVLYYCFEIRNPE